MNKATISAYKEGVTWLVGLSAAAAAGAFLHYDALSGAPFYAKLFFVLVVCCFLAAVYCGVQYAFWLHRIVNQQENREELVEKIQRGVLPPPEVSNLEQQIKQIEQKIAEAKTAVIGQHNRLLWSFGLGLAGAAIILAMGVFGGKTSSTNTQNGSKGDCCQVNVKFSDPVEKALLQHLTAGPTTPTAPTNDGGKLDPELQQALWQHVQNPPAATPWSPWIILSIVGVLTAGAVIALIAIMKPEASALSVAVALFGTVTGVIVKLAEQKPHLPSSPVPWWVVLVSITAVAAAGWLIFVGARQVTFLVYPVTNPTMVAGVPSEEARKEKTQRLLQAISLVVFGFSAILIALMPAMVFSGDEKKTVTTTSTSAVMPPGQLSVKRLDSISNLGDGDETIGPARIQALISNASAKGMKAGDILLLLGSADCRAVKKGGRWKDNDALAAARADRAKEALHDKSQVDGVRVEANPLPQHIGCRPSPDVRAVYPFLIHSEKASAVNPKS